jgi:chaperonin GroES
MKVKPLHDWAVIERSEAEERSPGGIIIPDTARDKPSEGIVVSIGPGSYRKIKGKEKFVPTTLQPGQRVAYPKYAAREAEAGGKKFILVREDDILGTYEGERRPVKETRVPEGKKEKPMAERERKKGVPAASLKKPRSEKKESVKKRTAQKAAAASERKKTKKAIAKKTAKTKATPKAVKKSVTREKGKTVARKPVKKSSAGKKKRVVRVAPSRKKVVQKKKTRP